MDIRLTLEEAVKNHASDIFIIAGKALSYKTNGCLVSMGEKLLPPDTESLIRQIYDLASRDICLLEKNLDDDFSFSLASMGRFRVNTFMQRGSMAAVLKVVLFQLPDPSVLRIPKQVIDLYEKTKGFILVTGPTGSGKSTTLACLIDKINKTRESHIITLEDPLEFLHKHDKSIVSQREVYMDTPSYERGLRAALREAPNVILLGEMRDLETISIALSAAETGQLVFSTLHTLGAANTVDRIVDVFPANQQRQVRIQLSMVLQAVISQQLIPSTKGTLVPAFEIMLCNNAIRNMIRESKVHQIDSTIYSSAEAGMVSMDSSIYNLYSEGLITAENAVAHSMNPDAMKKKLGLKSEPVIP
ncbi:type IV pilus twitching motility protein PilT [Sinanaerobacter chloroacetimidivorans]|uniref:PilT/PilU family type 4a pilus ATPase n=1 Tax=Sinanaerobacter chloroacetimidivorans TaxID=2818044 RepID=A0A8J8B227_9FIRM|nr:PilT/PilU family type 4a pilus ATPase [Sinanaerobacter chloroacetimidivorans]MBR0598854.1 PilT/PilU family type 4a pilus ATPase [Sinanaerobacter chloroacetimidivorans]